MINILREQWLEQNKIVRPIKYLNSAINRFNLVSLLSTKEKKYILLEPTWSVKKIKKVCVLLGNLR